MSQTMEQTDATSLRDIDEPEKKQKSRRPASTSTPLPVHMLAEPHGREGSADSVLQTPPSGNND